MKPLTLKAPLLAAVPCGSAAQAEPRLNYDIGVWLADSAALSGGAASVVALNDRLPTSLPAEEAHKEEWIDISGTIGVVSDYRFRGVSLSNGRPVPQAGLSASYGPFSAGLWTSRITRTGSGSRQEVDLSLAAAAAIASFHVTGTGLLYISPGDGGARYAELALYASRGFAPFTTSADFSGPRLSPRLTAKTITTPNSRPPAKTATPPYPQLPATNRVLSRPAANGIGALPRHAALGRSTCRCPTSTAMPACFRRATAILPEAPPCSASHQTIERGHTP